MRTMRKQIGAIRYRMCDDSETVLASSQDQGTYLVESRFESQFSMDTIARWFALLTHTYVSRPCDLLTYRAARTLVYGCAFSVHATNPT